MKPRATLAWWLLFAGLLALAMSRPARAVEHLTAGSAQLDYHLVGSKAFRNQGAAPTDFIDGFTIEAALKMAVDVEECGVR